MPVQFPSTNNISILNNMSFHIIGEHEYSNVTITPPIHAKVGTQVLIYSSARNIINIDSSYVEIILTNGSVFIHPDRLILKNEDKLKLGAEFLRWLQEDIVFMTEDSHLDLNHYFFVYPSKTYFRLELGNNKEPSPDWLIVKSFYDRYISLKAFW